MNIYQTQTTELTPVERALAIVRATVDIPETLDITAAITAAMDRLEQDHRNDLLPLLVTEITRQITSS